MFLKEQLNGIIIIIRVLVPTSPYLRVKLYSPKLFHVFCNACIVGVARANSEAQAPTCTTCIWLPCSQSLLDAPANRKTLLQSVVHGSCDDDDDFYLFLQKQQPAQRYIPIGYFPPGIKESTCDDTTIMSLMVL